MLEKLIVGIVTALVQRLVLWASAAIAKFIRDQRRKAARDRAQKLSREGKELIETGDPKKMLEGNKKMEEAWRDHVKRQP